MRKKSFVEMGVPIEVVDLWIKNDVRVVDGFPEHVTAIDPYPGSRGFVVHCDDYERLHPLVQESADRIVVMEQCPGGAKSVVKKDRWKPFDPECEWFTTEWFATAHEAVADGWTMSVKMAHGGFWDWNVLGPSPNGYSCSGRSDSLECAKRDAERTKSDLMSLRRKP